MNKCFGLLVLLLVSCTAPKTLQHPESVRHSVRHSIASKANAFIGTRYRYGGVDKRGLDCSGLVFTVFKDHAISLPRSSSAQMKLGKKISPQKARVGDLIFFRQAGKINHVAIITGVRNGEIWVTHCTTSRGVIREKLFESHYWTSRIEGVRDVLSGMAAK